MDGLLKKKEKELAKLELDEEIAGKRRSIAEQRAIEKKMKHSEGRDWKKILGVVKGLASNPEKLQDLYGVSGDLKEYSRPSKLRRL